MSSPTHPRRVISEPRLVLLALIAVAVGILCVVALADTDDVWIIAATVVAILLVGIGIVVDVTRLIGDSGEDASSASD